MSVKFYFLLGINSSGTLVMLIKAYKNDAMLKTQVSKWFFVSKAMKRLKMTNLVLDLLHLIKHKSLKSYSSCAWMLDNELLCWAHKFVGYI